jgi:DNA-binding YbaB/EbfC family protein
MNIEKMMKDLQRMQAKLQDEIETLEVEATSGGGIVTARMNGKKDLVGLTLTADAVTPDDPGMMQDLIIAAINEAGRKIDAEVLRRTQGLASGLKLPGRP